MVLITKDKEFKFIAAVSLLFHRSYRSNDAVFKNIA